MSGPAPVGVLLAAGEGRRLGQPKALVTDSSGRTWLTRSVDALRDAGMAEVYVVVGAAEEAVRAAVPSGCEVVVAADWREGMGASLRAGVRAVATEQPESDAVVIMLVDTPGVGAPVLRRLARLTSPGVLARASFDGQPGHPVLVGRDHWTGAIQSAAADRGARDYLRTRDVTLVECADIGDGADIDTPDLLAAWRALKP